MNGKWSQENFELHHKTNPQIYNMFVDFALQVASRREYYSAKNIFHRIRWETMIEESASQFKIDDGWISHYARKFASEYTDHKDLFKFRKRKNSYHGGD
jgi:cyclophilin family peptidyl-prolyl cis-trans isomerase